MAALYHAKKLLSCCMSTELSTTRVLGVSFIRTCRTVAKLRWSILPVDSWIWSTQRCAICSTFIRRPACGLFCLVVSDFPDNFLSEPTSCFLTYGFCVRPSAHIRPLVFMSWIHLHCCSFWWSTGMSFSSLLPVFHSLTQYIQIYSESLIC